ncbi:hypothetical protein INT46_009679, partial [Mucor plumbeus]
MSNIINNKQITGSATKDRQQSMSSANNEHSVSSDMDVEMGTSLSSGQDVNALSNNDALHSVGNACSEDARITRELSEDALPHYYDDIIMSDNEFDLQLDGDECPSLGKEHQVKLLNEIKQLRVQLYRATALSIKHIDNGVLASKASALKRQLKLVKENYDLLFDESNSKNAVMGESSLVPSDTPFMQWKGHKFNTKKFIFQSMDACLTQFEDVLESRSIDVEANWKRIIKPKMSTGMADWTRKLIEQYPSISWGQFKLKLKAKYSVSEAEEKKAALNKLKNLKLEKCDNLEEYIDKFINLKDLAGIKEDTSLTDYLLKGLEMDLYSPVSLNISQSRHKEKDTLDYAISQLRSVYDLLRRDSYYKEEKRRKEKEYEQRIIDAVQQRQFYNRGQSRNDKFSKNYRQQPYGNRPLNNKKLTRRAGKFNKKGAEALKCYDCGYTPFTYSHKAVCKKNPNNIKRNNKNKGKKSIVPTPAATMDTDDSSSENDESEQRFAVATIVPKKKEKEASKMDTDSECKHFD